MSGKNSTLRLIYPQWQGGGSVADFLPELPADEAYKGYHLGAHLLSILAPPSGQMTAEVPVSLDIADRAEERGVISYRAILRQTGDAMDILKQHDPDRIVTLGGECSVSVVPFTYLAAKYAGDVAIVWLDAHPDLNLPGEGHRGYHAMALAMSMGRGDAEILKLLPAKVDASKALIVGLRAWEVEGGTKERQWEFGVKSLAPAEVADDSAAVLEWLRSTGVSKVLIHFDLDVIDPTEVIAAVGTDPDGMKIDHVTRIINDIAGQVDVVGLTIAEHMPRTAIKVRNLLGNLPLLRN